MALFNIIADVIHVVSVFRLKRGKIVSSDKGLILFGTSLAYILTMLICGF